MCKDHNKNFKYYCKSCLLNLCEKCKEDHHYDNQHEFIEIENTIDKKKLNEIIPQVNTNNENNIFNEVNDLKINEYIETIKLNPIKDNLLEKVTEEEENEFKKLIRIIINDYMNYPNFSHFFNIKNIFIFFI